MTYVNDFFTNIPLIASMLAVIVAQLLKFILYSIRDKKLSWYSFVTTGGMPSSHSACVGALWISTSIIHGFGSIYCAITFILGAIVYRDAIGVRRQAGIHAGILNNLMEEKNSLNESEKHKPLKTFLGHTPMQALIGLALGIIIGIISTIS